MNGAKKTNKLLHAVAIAILLAISAPCFGAYAQDTPPAALANINKQGFDALVASSKVRPVFIMLYASWCPHCKHMFAELNRLQDVHGDAIRIVAISIDSDRSKAQAFASSITPMHLESYIVEDAASYFALGEALRAYGFNFKGGLTNAVGVPHNVAFFEEKAVAEIAGALRGANLDSLIANLVNATKKTKPPIL